MRLSLYWLLDRFQVLPRKYKEIYWVFLYMPRKIELTPSLKITAAVHTYRGSLGFVRLNVLSSTPDTSNKAITIYFNNCTEMKNKENKNFFKNLLSKLICNIKSLAPCVWQRIKICVLCEHLSHPWNWIHWQVLKLISLIFIASDSIWRQ